MFQSQIVAVNFAGTSEQATVGPIAGIARALPLSIILWAMIFGALLF